MDLADRPGLVSAKKYSQDALSPADHVSRTGGSFSPSPWRRPRPVAWRRPALIAPTMAASPHIVSDSLSPISLTARNYYMNYIYHIVRGTMGQS
jgi:hypothetical protein